MNGGGRKREGDMGGDDTLKKKFFVFLGIFAFLAVGTFYFSLWIDSVFESISQENWNKTTGLWFFIVSAFNLLIGIMLWNPLGNVKLQVIKEILAKVFSRYFTSYFSNAGVPLLTFIVTMAPVLLIAWAVSEWFGYVIHYAPLLVLIWITNLIGILVVTLYQFSKKLIWLALGNLAVFIFIGFLLLRQTV